MEKAPAKLNLTLEIIGRRNDGFHDLMSVMQTVDLHDVVRCHVTDDSALTFECNVKELSNENNTVYKSAVELRDYAVSKGWRRNSLGAAIKLAKKIPIAAGLAGGSSDAAATLRALNALWKLNLSMTELVSLSLKVGCDVPFLVSGGTALVGGRGELITQLPSAVIPGYVTIVVPEWNPDGQGEGLSKSGTLFKHITSAHFSAVCVSSSLTEKVRRRETVVDDDLANVFKSVVNQAFPGWNSFHSNLEHGCSQRFALSGTGPAMYALGCDKTTATQAMHIADRAGIPVQVFSCCAQ